jgi:hypothetical protein
MDALGSLDLYWKSLHRRDAVRMSDSSVSAWLALAQRLENDVKEVRDINADSPDTNRIPSVEKSDWPSRKIRQMFKCLEQCCRHP